MNLNGSFNDKNCIFTLAPMTENLPIEKMTTKEKVRLMERLWTELSRLGSGYEPPAWHGDELSRREKSLSDDQEAFTGWDQAKEEIRKRVS